MQKIPKTIYQAARFSTDLKQEPVAELMHISVESLRAYESGVTIPPADIVIMMIETYCTPWLAYQHLKTSTLVGEKYLPDIDFRDLPTSVLMLQKEMADTYAVNRDMIDVTCDGQIDAHEHTQWGKVTTEIKQLIGAGFSLLFAPVQKEKVTCTAMQMASRIK